MYPKPGDRVEMTGIMPDDPDPLDIGEQGTVVSVNADVRQIHVRWDSGRTLMLLTTDPFRVVD